MLVPNLNPKYKSQVEVSVYALRRLSHYALGLVVVIKKFLTEFTHLFL
jgi:hypothetical protein